jgi:hypothetical protein
MVKANGPTGPDTHRLVEIDSGAFEDANELRMRTEPDAAARQLVVAALEHDRLPADRALQMRSDESA